MKKAKLLLVLLAVSICAVCFSSQHMKSYADDLSAAQKLKRLGIIFKSAPDITEKQFQSFLKQPATRTGALLAVLRLVNEVGNGKIDNMGDTSICARFYQTTVKSTNRRPYLPGNGVRDMLDVHASVSSIQVYRYLLTMLGFTVSEFGSTDQEIMDFLQKKGYGFHQAVENKGIITNEDLCSMLYETLFIKTAVTSKPLYRVICDMNETFGEIAGNLGMADFFPSYIPQMNDGMYIDGSFHIYLNEGTNKGKKEWEASYRYFTGDAYQKYKNVLHNGGWQLEMEYQKTNNSIETNNALYYKILEDYELYCLITWSPAGDGYLWAGY